MYSACSACVMRVRKRECQVHVYCACIVHVCLVHVCACVVHLRACMCTAHVCSAPAHARMCSVPASTTHTQALCIRMRTRHGRAQLLKIKYLLNVSSGEDCLGRNGLHFNTRGVGRFSTNLMSL